MHNNSKNNGFRYTYSANEQEELKSIRDKYITPEEKPETTIEQLRRLDNGVTQKAQAISLVFGVIGTLILGFGMSLIMSDFSAILGAYKHLALLFGIIIGVVGGVIAGLAYPMYNLTIKNERAKIAPEIIRLTDELMK